MATNKPRTCRAVEPNVGVRATYSKQIKRLQTDFSYFVLKQILLQLDEQNLLTQDSAFDPKNSFDKERLKALKKKVLQTWAKASPEALKGRVDSIISSNLVKWLTVLGKVSTKVAANFVKGIVLSTSNAQRKALLSARFNKGLISERWSVPVVKGQYVSPEAFDLVASQIEQNVALITKIGSDDITRISEVITNGLIEGKDDDELREALRQTNGFNEGRIERVVIDQTNKLNQAVQTANANSLGITEAIWKHVPGQYSSRETHIQMDGKKFNINEGLYDKAVGYNVRCGELPFCRCQMRLIFKREQTND